MLCRVTYALKRWKMSSLSGLHRLWLKNCLPGECSDQDCQTVEKKYKRSFGFHLSNPNKCIGVEGLGFDPNRPCGVGDMLRSSQALVRLGGAASDMRDSVVTKRLELARTRHSRFCDRRVVGLTSSTTTDSTGSDRSPPKSSCSNRRIRSCLLQTMIGK